MITPRWRKMWRDVSAEKGRALLMVAAVAVSLAGLGTVLGGFAILRREMPRNYLGTRPASAAFELRSGASRALAEETRRRPGVADTDVGDIVRARAKVGEDWIPLLLFVVDDFAAMRLNTVTRLGGAWPPPDGTMLIERSAAPVLAAGVGASVLVKSPHGIPRPVPIAGVVHDPALAPAWQERTGYAYVTPATLALLGEPPRLDELRVAVSDGALDVDAIERKVDELSRWLTERGHVVKQVRVPPPGRHPHQGQLTGVLFLMLAFSAMTIVLGGILVANSMAAILARQVREIGVMKAVGACSGQLAALYAAYVGSLGAVAVMLALPAGLAGARSLASVTARLLNLTLESAAIPAWVFAVQAAAGIFVPLLVAAVPIARGCRVTVRAALDQHGASLPARRARWLGTPRTVGEASGLPRASIGWMRRTLVLAARNAFRRRTRLALMLTLLAAGGAMFMTARNLGVGWARIVDRVYEDRSYDVEIRLDAPAAIAERLREVEGVRALETWGYAPAALWRPDRVDVVRTYPDGGHGSLAVMGPPAETRLVRFPLLAGRWLRPGDTDAVVLNQMVLGQRPQTRVGDEIALSIEGRPTTWRVVGLVEEIGSPAIAYVTDMAFRRATGVTRRTRMLRIATAAGSREARADVVRALERRLDEEQASVELVVPLTVLRTAMGDHVAVLIRLLLAMAGLTVAVGMLGLASTMGISMTERTREIGIMKAIGATPRQIGALVVTEALLIGLLSWGVATALAVPLTALVARIVGMLSFRVPLPFVMDPAAVGWWLGLALPVAALATLLPARRASKLSARVALAA